jgi:hypothetical protein
VSATAAAKDSHGDELFFHELRRDGRPIVVLRGVASGTAAVVEADVYPLTEQVGGEPLHRPFPFATVAQAKRFADEALQALEHLGCTVAGS